MIFFFLNDVGMLLLDVVFYLHFYNFASWTQNVFRTYLPKLLSIKIQKDLELYVFELAGQFKNVKVDIYVLKL